MGPSIKNLDKLLYMPSGCGEQNLVTIVPRVIALEYLARSNRLTENIKAKAIANLRKGKIHNNKYFVVIMTIKIATFK